MEVIKNKTFDEERALYGSRNLLVKDCRFDGPADGESAFKEAQDIQVENVFFNHKEGLIPRSLLRNKLMTNEVSLALIPRSLLRGVSFSVTRSGMIRE